MKKYNSPILEEDFLVIGDVMLESSQEIFKTKDAFDFDITERI